MPAQPSSDELIGKVAWAAPTSDLQLLPPWPDQVSAELRSPGPLPWGSGSGVDSIGWSGGGDGGKAPRRAAQA